MKFIGKIKRHFIKHSKEINTEVYLGDLLNTKDGIMSGIQYVIAERILFLETMEHGNNFDELLDIIENFYSFDCRDKIELVKEEQIHFLEIISAIKNYGYNSLLARNEVRTAINECFLPNDGTHRFAICYVFGFLMLPIRINVLKPWYTINGKKYFMQLGVSEKYLEKLEHKFNQVSESLERPLCLYLNSIYADNKDIINKISEIGRFEECKFSYLQVEKNAEINFYAKYHLKKINKFGNKIILYDFYPYSKDFYFDGKKIISRQIKELENSINYKDWGGVTHSVTETVSVRPYLEELVKD